MRWYISSYMHLRHYPLVPTLIYNAWSSPWQEIAVILDAHYFPGIMQRIWFLNFRLYTRTGIGSISSPQLSCICQVLSLFYKANVCFCFHNCSHLNCSWGLHCIILWLLLKYLECFRSIGTLRIAFSMHALPAKPFCQWKWTLSSMGQSLVKAKYLKTPPFSRSEHSPTPLCTNPPISVQKSLDSWSTNDSAKQQKQTPKTKPDVL